MKTQDAAFLALICVLLLGHILFLSCVMEDSFISFRYAKNLVDGHGLRWNPGEEPVEGYTNFLWVLLCSLALKAGIGLPLFSQILGILAAFLTLVYVFRFSRKILGWPVLAALFPCLLLSLSGPFATWAGSGMETNLFTLLLAAAIYHFAFSFRSDDRKHLFSCYLFTFLATLTRPEGFGVFLLLAALSLAAVLWLHKPFRYFALPVLAYLIPFGLYLGWKVSYFGSLLPNTFYAKTGGTVHQYLRGLRYTGTFLLFFVLSFLFLLVFLILERKKVAFRSASASPQSADRMEKTGLFLCAVFVFVYTLFIVYEGGDYMAMFRFFVPLLPPLYILLSSIIYSLFRIIGSSRGKRILASGLVVFALLITLLQSTPLEKMIFPTPVYQEGTYRGVLNERWHVARLSLIGKYFRRHKKSTEESLATRAIGAISYYAEMKIIDLHGLVDPVIARQKKKDIGREYPGHEKSDMLYTLTQRRPTFIVFDRRFYKRPQRPPRYDPESDRLIAENYKLSSVRLVDKANGEEGFLSFLELIDR
jgi:arabinofuranosyltransferase